ncbi:MAG: tRNA guanosine(34) transglycosylase Tgt [Nitrospiraceae bacterium]|nr:tRNA guanosine(34) transglycosylase Tgt [Nitrospiraceae bacterium]
MTLPQFFRVLDRDAGSRARTGLLHTSHGVVETPAFMPVGTRGTVKGMTPDSLAACGVSILLVNAFHLWLRPGTEIVCRAGGIGRMMGIEVPTLSDSGGYQVLSLLHRRKVTEEGVSFLSPYDGAKVFLSPELAVSISSDLGVDIRMVLDDLAGVGEPSERIAQAMERTHRWARRSLDVWNPTESAALFGIVQGGVDPGLREKSAEGLVGLRGKEGQAFSGFGIGGLGVGESFEERCRVLSKTLPILPDNRPRYLMGVGYPGDIVEAVRHGVDLFDCVLPTRNARNGMYFTWNGPISIRNARYREDDGPIDPACPCATCRRHSRSYLHHLVKNAELTGAILGTIHNVCFYMNLMSEIRRRISEGRLSGWDSPCFKPRETEGAKK